MTDMVENTNTAGVQAQQPGLISTIFRCYRENFALFWRIMMPVVLFGFLFDVGISFSDSFSAPENLWRFDTARGVFVSEYPKSAGVGWGWIFIFHISSIGWLWLTMCPLIFAIVERRRGVVVTSRSAWRRARGHAGPILAASLLLYLLGVGSFLPCTRVGNADDASLSGVWSGQPSAISGH